MRKGVQMVNGIGSAGSTRVDTPRPEPVRQGAAPRAAGGAVEEVGGVGYASPAAEIAGAGAPVDAQKVAAIRAAIAEGRYPIDPSAIAQRMIELDLPVKPA